MAALGRLANPLRHSVACVRECRSAQASWRRLFSMYSANPAQYQSDPCVQMYGQLLAVRDEQPDAFLVAAETLRAQLNLPADLRSSASRSRASVLFQRAAKVYESLEMSVEAPWPAQAFKDALEAASLACDAYEDALTETADPDLCKDVAPYVAEWPAVISATEAAYVEVRKLRATLRLREVRWHEQQAEYARAISEAARRPGSSSEAATRGAEGLHAAGLDLTVEEEDLLRAVLAAAENMITECAASEHLRGHTDNGNDGQAVLKTLRAKGQVAKIMAQKDLAIASAMTYNLDSATSHIVSALQDVPEDPKAFPTGSAEQLRAAAKGVLELCGREMQRSDTKSQAAAASKWATEISEAVAKFDSRHDSE